jgi:GWxTD domain-containing protein
MIKRFLVLILVLQVIFQPVQAMRASVDVYQFQTDNKSFVEIFFYILGSSVESGEEFPPSVQITYMIMRDSVVAAGDKYNLVGASNSDVSDFMDLHRHFLSEGTYSLVVDIMDNNNPADIVHLKRNITIRKVELKASLSDLQLLSIASPADDQIDKWTKNNIRYIPLPFGYCSQSYEQLDVYSELYHTEQSLTDDFYVKYTVAPVSNPEIELLTSHKRLSPGLVIPLLQRIDISGLSSGRYILKLGAYTQSHELICENIVIFSRSNPDIDADLLKNFDKYFAYSFTLNMDADSLEYALKALAPKISPIKMDALNYLIRQGELDEKRRFIHRYWVESNPSDPEAAYQSYMQVAAVVDQMFHSGLGYGFETDRGNIFMKYGAPNDVISVENEPSAPPYEIWIYYNFPLTAQFNVKFLFYSPELANTYDLLHSTCENEIYNAAWEQILYKNALTETRSGDLIDARPVAPNFNRRAKEYFTDN